MAKKKKLKKIYWFIPTILAALAFLILLAQGGETDSQGFYLLGAIFVGVILFMIWSAMMIGLVVWWKTKNFKKGLYTFLVLVALVLIYLFIQNNTGVPA